MDFEVRRDDLHATRFVGGEPPEPADGEAVLSISRFGLTANNVTYAVFGDAMNYWDFFPTEDGWGRLPVWGFADVAASAHDGVEVGKRVYGYYSASSHLLVKPGRADENGFFDSAEHRASLPVVYNHYVYTDADPNYEERHEAEQMLLRPLFATSFLLDDQVADSDFFGAEQVVLSSASSKTALAAAFLIARREGPDVVGLTSASRVGFVERTGTYDQVASYEELAELGDRRTVYLDFAGDADMRGRVHGHFGESLAHSYMIGMTHWDRMDAGDGELPGPKPEFFFAPDRAAKRTDDWGGAGLRARIADAWAPFVEWSTGWLEIRRGEGAEAVEAAYREMLEGRVDPALGHVLSLA
jgi:hypothetical protein